MHANFWYIRRVGRLRLQFRVNAIAHQVQPPMKIPRPKPHNPVPPPPRQHKDRRREAEKRACRPDQLREHIAQERDDPADRA